VEASPEAVDLLERREVDHRDGVRLLVETST
jgi:hypothetical protein